MRPDFTRGDGARRRIRNAVVIGVVVTAAVTGVSVAGALNAEPGPATGERTPVADAPADATPGASAGKKTSVADAPADADVPGTAKDGASVADASDESKDFPFPGADTMPLPDGSGKYITYGASEHGRNVPYALSGSGNDVGTSPKIRGDALPKGGGAWAERGKIWTPGAFHHKDRYYLFYTGVKKGTDDKHCVGVASSEKPGSGFKAEPKPLVCPTHRWAIDADVTKGSGGAIWMTYRDGEAAEGKQSALSVMRLKFRDDGTVDRASRSKVMLRSDKLSWAAYKDTKGVVVIENPSAIEHRGRWYLFYSGNSWKENYYSTGIADCGPKIDDGACKPLPGPRQAWFAYSGTDDLPASMRKTGLPGNKPGPGAMDVYRARDGKPWVTWNYRSEEKRGRKSRTGRLLITGAGSSVHFKVVKP